MYTSKDGFTILEVLLFTTLISLVFVAIAYLATFSLVSSRLSTHKVVATHFAEELEEWLRGEKEVDWNTFAAKANTEGLLYCVNAIPADISVLTSGTGCGSTYGLAPIYKREVTLKKNEDGTQVVVTVRVEWKENNNTFAVPISTIFSVWE